MIPVKFPRNNTIMNGGDHPDIPVYVDQHQMISCWKLNVADIESVNKNGLIWLTLLGNLHPPVGITTNDPFVVPRDIVVNKQIADKIMCINFEGDEFVYLNIEPDECSFKVAHKEETWVLTFCKIGYGDQRYSSLYEFKEEIEVVGMASDHLEFGITYERNVAPAGWALDETLILKRINSKFEEITENNDTVKSELRNYIEYLKSEVKKSSALLKQSNRKDNYVRSAEYHTREQQQLKTIESIQRIIEGKSFNKINPIINE